MTMSPEERRRRMHKALERSGGARSARSRGSNPDAEITDYSFDADEFQLKKNTQNNTKQEGPDIRLDAV